MFVLGGAVSDGKVYGEWPGLEPEQLCERRFECDDNGLSHGASALVVKQVGIGEVSRVFPGFAAASERGILFA